MYEVQNTLLRKIRQSLIYMVVVCVKVKKGDVHSSRLGININFFSLNSLLLYPMLLMGLLSIVFYLKVRTDVFADKSKRCKPSDIGPRVIIVAELYPRKYLWYCILHRLLEYLSMLFL